MEQFSLDKWLQDKSRKVVTRDGRKVRILCWDAESSKPIVALVSTRSISQRQFNDLTVSYFNDGTYYGKSTEDFIDLFFADEEEELTEFDYAVLSIISDHNSHKDSIVAFAKRSSKKLLELARKELEKDQKPTIIIPRFRVGDKIRRKNPRLYDKDMLVSRVGSDHYICNHLGKFSSESISFSEESDYELVEQKSADKVEPKFKIEKGKWYVCIKDLLDNYANTAFCEGDTYLSTQDGSLIPSNSNVPFDVVCPNVYFRDWTIEDAKDGDVLAIGNEYFLFKEKKENTSPVVYISHCFADSAGPFRITNGRDCGEFHSIENGIKVYPATKEQRNFLFQKMREAGYEWDSDKKELKKIEQTSAWSEEDEKMIETICKKGNLKPSEQHWLKSLKPHWKPSEEQMEALFEAKLASTKNREYFLGLLYEDLKKL